MNTNTTSTLWVVMLSLVSIIHIAGATLTQSQVIAASGSAGSSSGGSHETSKPAKPRSPQPADSMKHLFDRPGHTPTPQETLEERLRSGQMDRPAAQGEVSDRLEQLHRGSGSLNGETSSGQSNR